MPDRSKVMTKTKKGYIGPPGWGFGVGLATPHSKKLIVTRVEKRKGLRRWKELKKKKKKEKKKKKKKKEKKYFFSQSRNSLH
jgi:hypothetical protein